MIGFIGVGNMGFAIYKKLRKHKNLRKIKNLSNKSFYLFDKDLKKLKNLAHQNSVVTSDLKVLFKCQYVFIAVKPNDFDSIASQISNLVKPKHVLISVMAGIKLSYLAKKTNQKGKWVRVMPNLPAVLGKGVGGVTFSSGMVKKEKETILEWFNQLGYFYEVEEDKLDVITALTGSGPAFVFTFIQALVDGAVRQGLKRGVALKSTIKMIKGSCELIVKDDTHPLYLRDQVASPGGTTVEGLAALSEHGFEKSVMKAIEATYKKSKLISKK